MALISSLVAQAVKGISLGYTIFCLSVTTPGLADSAVLPVRQSAGCVLGNRQCLDV
jgi:hypothetical protein